MSKITDFDRYLPMVTEASAKAKVLLPLAGDHVVFYVTAATKELRVRAYGSKQVFTLMQGVEHCHGFVQDDVAFVYVATSAGSICLLPYRYFGEQLSTPQAIIMGYNAQYLHVITQGGKYLMVVDAGGRFHLLSSDDLTFASRFQSQQIYSNLRDVVYRVSNPTLGIHPQDIMARPIPSRVTIAFERETLTSGTRAVGFMVTEVVL